MIPPGFLDAFDKIATSVGLPKTLLAELYGSDESYDELIERVAKLAALPAESVAAVLDACADDPGDDEPPQHDEPFGFRVAAEP